MSGYKIARDIGAQMGFTGGEEPESPVVTVIQSRYHDADDGDKLLKFEGSLEISLETLTRIIEWASSTNS